MTTITIENREIAIMAFDKLCRENKKDSALRLAGCMLKHSYISLGIGDIDWEIDMAIRNAAVSREPVTDIPPVSIST